MNVWFTSDLHFGHNNICKYRTQFKTEEEHRTCLKDNICSVVRPKDILWILGDSVFTEETLDDLKSLPGVKKLIIGNHCAQHFDQKLLYDCFKSVHGLFKKYRCWLSHAPVHPDELRGYFNIHGHSHNHIIDDLRYINICPEHHNFFPRDLSWIREEIKRREKLL